MYPVWAQNACSCYLITFKEQHRGILRLTGNLQHLAPNWNLYFSLQQWFLLRYRVLNQREDRGHWVAGKWWRYSGYPHQTGVNQSQWAPCRVERERGRHTRGSFISNSPIITSTERLSESRTLAGCQVCLNMLPPEAFHASWSHSSESLRTLWSKHAGSTMLSPRTQIL